MARSISDATQLRTYNRGGGEIQDKTLIIYLYFAASAQYASEIRRVAVDLNEAQLFLQYGTRY